MGYISKVKIPSETEAYDIFADKSSKDGDGNVISTTYLKTADAPKIGTADTNNKLKKIEYTEESAIPSSPDTGTEYACTDPIGYGDLDSDLQSTLSTKANRISPPASGTVLYGVSSTSTDGQPQAITAGDGIVIDAKSDGTGAEVKVDPDKGYLKLDDVSQDQIPIKGDNRWSYISHAYLNVPYTLVKRGSAGEIIVYGCVATGCPPNDGYVSRMVDLGLPCEITGQPASSTAGTLTNDQLIILKGYGTSDTEPTTTGNAYILFNNERYYPMSYGHEEGYQTYSNVDSDTIKRIKVNMTSGGWTLTTNNVGGTVVTTDGVAQAVVATEDFVKHASDTSHNVVYASLKGVDNAAIFTDAPNRSTMMYRDTTGNTQVSTPTIDAHCANKAYVDNNFVKKYAGETGKYTVYGVVNGEQANFLATAESTPSSIMMRNELGTAQTVDPISAQDIANKAYVDAHAGATNIQNGAGTGAVKQLTDPKYSSLAIATKNPNAAALDSTLTDSEPLGAVGDYSSAFGGNTSAQGKRSCASGTSTLAKGAYSHAEGDSSVSLGDDSHAEGYQTTAKGDMSHTEGGYTIASGQYSHAEGFTTTASGEASHAEGGNTTATQPNAHAEGIRTQATAAAAHAEGGDSIASGEASHAEGGKTAASGSYAHAEGDNTKAKGDGSHAEGSYTEATGNLSHAEGYLTKAQGDTSHAEGNSTTASGTYSHAEGNGSVASGDISHAEGTGTTAAGFYTHAEGGDTTANGSYAHAEGRGSVAEGGTSHAEGDSTAANGACSHTEGLGAIANGDGSHAEGNKTTTSKIATYSHAEGWSTSTSGIAAHSEGSQTKAAGDYSHAEGNTSKANGNASHAEGSNTTASEASSHSEGTNTTASGTASHAEGAYTKAFGAYAHSEGASSVAQGESSHAQGDSAVANGKCSDAGGYKCSANGNYSFARGNNSITRNEGQSALGVGLDSGSSAVGGMFVGKYNAPDDNAIFQVGNGTSTTARSNAFSIDSSGNATVAGRLSVASAPVNDNDVVRKADLAGTGGGGSWHTEKPADTSKVQFTRMKILTTDAVPSGMVGGECLEAGYKTSFTGIWCVTYSNGVIRVIAGNASLTGTGTFGFTGTYLPEVSGSFLDTPNGGTCNVQYYY